MAQQLEQRVKTLEYEIKILKNQVQRALLDIQEQILIHYYPSLRTEESAPTKGDERSMASAREKGQLMGTAASPPTVDVMALSEWVSSTAQKIGKERLTKLIPACTRKGILTPDVEKSLLRLTGLVADGEPSGPVAINDILAALVSINELLGRASDVDEALSVIEEAHLG
jgi:hypothetical protein